MERKHMSEPHTDERASRATSPESRASSEAGFTLVEALIAIVILIFGLIAVTNLMVIGTSSNTVANHSTAATVQATEILERLKALPFTTLAAGGNIAADVGAQCDDNPPADCVVAGAFNARRQVVGVARITSRWQITAVDNQTFFIVVRSESLDALMIGPRSRAEFTTFRSCTSTDAGCPG